MTFDEDQKSRFIRSFFDAVTNHWDTIKVDQLRREIEFFSVDLKDEEAFHQLYQQMVFIFRQANETAKFKLETILRRVERKQAEKKANEDKK